MELANVLAVIRCTTMAPAVKQVRMSSFDLTKWFSSPLTHDYLFHTWRISCTQGLHTIGTHNHFVFRECVDMFEVCEVVISYTYQGPRPDVRKC